MEVFSKFILGIILVVAITIVPVYYTATQFDDYTRKFVFQATANFTDAIKEEGAVTLYDYSEFISRLDSTGIVFDIAIYLFRGVVDSNGETGFTQIYTDEILQEIYEGSGEVRLGSNDYCSVMIESRTETLKDKMEFGFLGIFGSEPVTAASGCSGG